MDKEYLAEVKKHMQKIRKLIMTISKDCNKYVDQFDTITYSLNKVDNIIAKVHPGTQSNQQENSKQHNSKKTHIVRFDIKDSDDSDQQETKVKTIIENVRFSTQTLSRKIKALCNLPVNNNSTSRQFKPPQIKKQYLKHSFSVNPNQFKNKRSLKNSSQKKRYHFDESQEHGSEAILKLDSDIRKLQKQLQAQIKNRN